DIKRMHRVTARVASDTELRSPAVVILSRLVVTGSRSTRLHEELTVAGGLIQQGRFSRLSVGQTEALLSTSRPTFPPKAVIATLRELWPSSEAPALAAAEARSGDRMKSLQNTLQRRREQEFNDITKLLEELDKSIREKLDEPEPEQAAFWPTEE